MKTKKKKTSIRRGVYFLANDSVLDMTIAFLNSFRKHNPGIDLCLIPFDDDSERVKALHTLYRFTILDSFPEKLEACDAIGRYFHGKNCGAYRKLVMWDGIFDEFIYIDVDTVVLANVDFVFGLLAEYDVITSHSNCPGLRRWVWKDSIFLTFKLKLEQIAYSAITSFIASRKSVMSLATIKKKLAGAKILRPHMELSSCMEQPLLNYFFVTSNCRYTSLVVLSWQPRYQGIKYEKWAGSGGGFAFKGKLYPAGKNPALLVHWANQWRPTRFDLRWHEITKKLGLNTKKPGVRFFIRYKRLWKYYRNMPAPAYSGNK